MVGAALGARDPANDCWAAGPYRKVPGGSSFRVGRLLTDANRFRRLARQISELHGPQEQSRSMTVPDEFHSNFGWTWPELGILSFSRAQPGTQLVYLGAFSRGFRRRSDARKCLTDAGLAMVPGGGIEPSTHGFSVRSEQTSNYCNCLIYQCVSYSLTLGIVGLFWVISVRRGQSHGQSQNLPPGEGSETCQGRSFSGTQSTRA